ncbi:MAG: hypothetical protein C0412_11925 [Flavobacterium sp.]|nr:hypothetical protein [Flavobacterium sp.]
MNKSKIMKRNVILALILLLLFASCKYEDGPLISLRSKEKRLLGEWGVVSLTVDGIDSTQLYNDSCGCGMRFYKDYNDDYFLDISSCKELYSGLAYFHAKFSFIEKNKCLKVITGDNGGIPITFIPIGPVCPGKTTIWEIQRLTHKQFWFSCALYNKNYYFKLLCK